MRLLYSNILPVGIEEGQATIAETFAEQIADSDSVEIAVGYVAKGTGALLSPNDWNLGGSFTNQVVLTMYKVTGRKGWNGRELWVPNIKLPNNVVYYDVKDAEETEV